MKQLLTKVWDKLRETSRKGEAPRGRQKPSAVTTPNQKDQKGGGLSGPPARRARGLRHLQPHRKGARQRVPASLSCPLTLGCWPNLAGGRRPKDIPHTTQLGRGSGGLGLKTGRRAEAGRTGAAGGGGESGRGGRPAGVNPGGEGAGQVLGSESTQLGCRSGPTFVRPGSADSSGGGISQNVPGHGKDGAPSRRRRGGRGPGGQGRPRAAVREVRLCSGAK